MPTARLFNYTVAYHSDAEYHSLKSEIFTDNTYFTDLDTTSPEIIDAGAHIGLSSLYFKHLWTGAKVLAIEPHPDSFKLLEENVMVNQLDNVTVLQLALSNSDQPTAILYADPDKTWLQSASITPGAWNGKQLDTTPVVVPAGRLSTLITKPIDLLKLDVEGAETAVIDDLIKHNKLTYCKNVIVEFHQTKNNDLNTFSKRLTAHNYKLIDTKNDPKEHKPNQNSLYILYFSISE